MSPLKLLGIAFVAVTFSVPAIAEEGMMKKGETMMVMPDGKTGMMMSTDKDQMSAMMKDAKAMDHCMMMTMGEDGRMYMAQDMKMSNGAMMCDSMMKK